MLKAFFALEIFTFLSCLFCYVGKQLDKKGQDNFKIYDVTNWTTNNYIYCLISQEVNATRQ